MLTAIILDMDGVITHTMPFHYLAWKKVFEKSGIYVNRFEVYSREGQKGLDSILEIFAKHKRPITLLMARKLLFRKERLFKKIVKERFVPGARTFIKKCRHSGYRLALVTGTSRHEVDKILPSRFLNYFDIIICGGDVKHGKPHPEPYLKALKALKVPRHKAIVVENAPFGISSAKRAGLRCLALKTSLPEKYMKQADKTFNNIRELEEYLYAHKTETLS